ncbi:MAG: hypothetical protein JSR66_26245 [Proteobacteria bacterium]|nr:hypothetical protein [Pseudomonadota bacterium]
MRDIERFFREAVYYFPRLAGQHSQYVLKQLGSLQSDMRSVAVMHGVAQSLRLEQMRAVAAYVESLD